jgi:putative flippase GtrA
MPVVVVIPAFRPSQALVDVVRELVQSALGRIVIVDDGSGDQFRGVFESCASLPRVEVLRHTANLGKGQALKSGIAHTLRNGSDLSGVVTADADGQHRANDIVKVAHRLAESPGQLVLGTREFSSHVPWRSRFGNILTRRLVRVLVGHQLSDTQTGLRGIPMALLPHLVEIKSSGYEFELDMLIAAKHHGCPIVEETVGTIYEPGNPTSHFNPLFDSMRIYFVLLRFSALSLLTAALDNVVFVLCYAVTGRVGLSQILGRTCAVIFNYGLARRAVFLSGEQHRTVLPKYLLLVAASGTLSYVLIRGLHSALGVPVVPAKIIAESGLFIINFLVQRDFIFKRRRKATATDWDRYYQQVPFTARLTRKYTTAVLIRAFKMFAARDAPTFVELGGANSCFLDRIVREVRPSAYHVVDTNESGLELLRRRSEANGRVRLHQQDVTKLRLDVQADLVFSVGLIEHFDCAGTRAAIESHFRLLKPGGCAVISFPTPTWCYRVARWFSEAFGLWHFPDERPLKADEIRASLSSDSEVLFEKTLWPLVFTQRLMVVRKSAAAQSVSAN